MNSESAEKLKIHEGSALPAGSYELTKNPISGPQLLTPLRQREWLKQAQRTIRLALTGARSSWSTFLAASECGHSILSGLSDSLLLMVQMPCLPLGALQDMEGIKEAAVEKLALRNSDLHLKLSNICTDMEREAEAIEEQCCEVEKLYISQELGLPPDRCSERPLDWCRSSPVFASISAPRCTQLLREVAEMMSKEAEVRRKICTALGSLPLGTQECSRVGSASNESLGSNSARSTEPKESGNSCLQVSESGSSSVRVVDETKLRSLLTAFLSTWLAGPYLDEDRAQEIFEGIAEDLTGF